MWARDLQSTEALTLRARHERWACTTAAIPTEGDLEQGQHLTIIAMGCRSLLPGVEVHCTGTATDHWGPQPHKQCNSHLADLHPASNYKCFKSSSVSVHSWSWNYRGCWHQTCPPVDTHHCVWIASIPSPTGHKDRQDCCSSLLPHQECFGIGQFARLLPTLVVVAISQAPSPEPNPDSLSPVTATVVQDTTVQADRSEARVIKQCCGHGPPLCQRSCPQTQESTGTSLSQPSHTTLLQVLVLPTAGCNPPLALPLGAEAPVNRATW